jgi:hypothetical protein
MSDAKSPRSPRPPRSQPRAPKPKPESKPEPGNSAPDFAILGGPTEDGEGTHLVRIRDGAISAGEIRPVKEGEPVTHRELVRLHPLDPERRVMRVETLHAPAPSPPQNTSLSRPARVSNDRYRKNYDAIFDPKRAKKKRDWSVN